MGWHLGRFTSPRYVAQRLQPRCPRCFDRIHRSKASTVSSGRECDCGSPLERSFALRSEPRCSVVRPSLKGRPLRTMNVGFPVVQPEGQLPGDHTARPTGADRPIPAHRRAPKLPDDRPRSFTVRIYEAAARGLRRSAVVHGRWLQGELKVIAASRDRSVIEQILNHLELGTQPPHQARRTSRARMARAAPLPPSVHAASVRQGELWPRAWTAPVLRVGRTLSELD
jgi:hypothetical protein